MKSVFNRKPIRHNLIIYSLFSQQENHLFIIANCKIKIRKLDGRVGVCNTSFCTSNGNAAKNSGETSCGSCTGSLDAAVGEAVPCVARKRIPNCSRKTSSLNNP